MWCLGMEWDITACGCPLTIGSSRCVTRSLSHRTLVIIITEWPAIFREFMNDKSRSNVCSWLLVMANPPRVCVWQKEHTAAGIEEGRRERAAVEGTI